MHNAVISATKLRIVRDGVTVLHDLSFSIGAGRITGLIGPSGSGKTTLMRTIVGVQRITGGELQVLGKSAGSPELRPQIGYVTQAPAVYDDLTAQQNLVYFAAMAGRGKDEVSRVLQEVDMTGHAGRLVGSMSGGQRTRVSLAVALLGAPQLLVLDEPTVGLDPVLRQSLWKLFASMAASGRSLVISSHVMDEAEQCTDLLLLRDGGMLHNGTRQSLLQATHTRSVGDAFLNLAGGSKQ